jgi:tRNA-2-methylthio-N6-dimethylallyladenosine synthase
MVGSATSERQRIQLKELQKKTPWADAYINSSQIYKVPQILFEHDLLSEWALKKFNFDEVQARVDSTHAFVNISNGCDNFCTFCVVPYARGREISRSADDILREINHLVARGVKTFTLCGQNVNSWNLPMSEKLTTRSAGEHKLPFADLLRKVHEIAGVEKIDFLSSNPFDFTSDLIDAVKLPKISNYLHIAVQSGNNAVLKKMNRRHTVEEFIDLIEKIKKAKPTAEIGTDIIVGFPSETREQFMDTVKLFEKVKFNVAFISIYSPRKGTPASQLYADDVTREEKKWRHAYLTKVWNETKKL